MFSNSPKQAEMDMQHIAMIKMINEMFAKCLDAKNIVVLTATPLPRQNAPVVMRLLSCLPANIR